LPGTCILPPLAFTSGLLAVWRIAADLKLAGDFAFSTGIWSHWQVWMGGAILLTIGARLLNRYGRGTDSPASKAAAS
jgi:hypothetical protein